MAGCEGDISRDQESASQCTYELLVSCSDPAYGEFYLIYEESLPLRERKSRAQISALLKRPDYRILLLKRNGLVVGFSVLFIASGELFSLLEYMAIHPSFRNSGFGGELFQRTFQSVVAGYGTNFGLLEVDSPWEQADDQEIRKRRERFYRRLGCLRLDGLSYLLPLSGEGPPPQMNLMVYFPNNIQVLNKHQLEQCLKVVYNKVYNCRPDDPRINRMMEQINDPVRLL